MGFGGESVKVTVVGLWHLGCVCAAGSAAAGHRIVGWDHDPAVVESLNSGTPLLFEPGLDVLLSSSLQAGTLTFTSDLAQALSSSELIWITYDTPVDEHDQADCGFIFDKVKQALSVANKNALILISSQLPVGSIGALEEVARGMGRGDVEFACSPENLRLGHGLRTFSQPDRVVCGVRSSRAKEALTRLWSPITDRLEFMSIESAEMTKHAINSFLAVSVAAEEVCAAMRTPLLVDPSGFLRDSIGMTAGFSYVSIGYIHNG